jgi:hypothetical protein
VHHVTVGEHEAIGRENKSRAAAVALSRLTIARAAAALRDLDLRYRWTDLFRR